jgi:hypothetical protein
MARSSDVRSFRCPFTPGGQCASLGGHFWGSSNHLCRKPGSKGSQGVTGAEGTPRGDWRRGPGRLPSLTRPQQGSQGWVARQGNGLLGLLVTAEQEREDRLPPRARSVLSSTLEKPGPRGLQ